jgi:hypothetical protein
MAMNPGRRGKKPEIKRLSYGYGRYSTPYGVNIENAI